MKKAFTLLLAICLASCAAPKASVVQETAPVKSVKNTVAETPKIPVSSDPTGGMRLPDMLTLPDETQLRSSTGPSGSNGGEATVTARPPKE